MNCSINSKCDNYDSHRYKIYAHHTRTSKMNFTALSVARKFEPNPSVNTASGKKDFPSRQPTLPTPSFPLESMRKFTNRKYSHSPIHNTAFPTKSSPDKRHVIFHLYIIFNVVYESITAASTKQKVVSEFEEAEILERSLR